MKQKMKNVLVIALFEITYLAVAILFMECLPGMRLCLLSYMLGMTSQGITLEAKFTTKKNRTTINSKKGITKKKRRM